jgi:thioredoxin-related protein
MRRLTLSALAAALVLVVLSACSKQASDVGASTTQAASTGFAQTASTTAPIAWFPGAVDAAFAEAQAKNKPVFLFWHAAWCPYCQDLKASVFTRPDVIAKLGFFVPVSLDGDLPGAQKISDEFHVAGYPTVLVLKGDRTELARISGGMDLNRYAEVLDVVLGDVKPVKALLDDLDHSAASLNATDCRRLAYNGWSLDTELTSSAEELRMLSSSLAKAASRCPAESKVERVRLTILAAAAATDAAEETLDAGKAPDAATTSLVNDVRALLEDVGLSTSVADSFQELSDNFFLAARLSSPSTAPDLMQKWTVVMNAAAEDKRYSEGQRLAAIAGELHAAQALSPKGVIPADMASAAEARVQETLAHKHDSFTRAAVVNAAIDILETLDEPQMAHTMVEAELKTATTPYYYMSHLASLDEKLGHPDRAVAWTKRAYEESKGPVTRFRWGTSYVTSLIRNRPADAAAIQQATLSVLGELGSADDLHGTNSSRLRRLSSALQKWNADGKHSEVLRAAQQRMKAVCGNGAEGDVAEACRRFLAS